MTSIYLGPSGPFEFGDGLSPSFHLQQVPVKELCEQKITALYDTCKLPWNIEPGNAEDEFNRKDEHRVGF